MRLLSNNRGQEQYIMVISIIIVFAAVLWMLLFAFVNNIGSENTYQRMFYAEDLGLIMTGLTATSGNIQTTYETESLNKYSYSFTDGEIKVEESGKTPVGRVYARDLAIPLLEEGSIANNPKRLVFEKDGNIMKVSTIKRELPIQRQCPDKRINERIVMTIPEIHKALRDGIYSTNQEILLLETGNAEGFKIKIEPRRGPMIINIPIEQDYEKAYYIACKIGNAVSRETNNPVIIKPVDITKTPGLKQGIMIEADRTIHRNEIGKTIGRALK